MIIKEIKILGVIEMIKTSLHIEKIDTNQTIIIMEEETVEEMEEFRRKNSLMIRILTRRREVGEVMVIKELEILTNFFINNYCFIFH